MANIHVFIELIDDRPAESSLEALGEGRRLASLLGATLSAIVACPEIPRYGDDDLVAVLGHHGADKVVLVNRPEMVGPALYAGFGPALARACERFPPALVLLAASPGGRDLGPRLAARLGAAFVSEPTISCGARGELIFSRPVYLGRHRRRLDTDELERPIVATLAPGAHKKAQGEDDAEAVVVTLEAPPPPPFAEVSREPDPGAALDAAAVVVTAGAGVTREALPLVAELAATLGGELAFTPTAVAMGLGPAERAVGLGVRQITPRLYVSCGASGSGAHLAAIPATATVVAIDRDATAPIFRVATYGLIGDVATVLPELRVALVELGRTPRVTRRADADAGTASVTTSRPAREASR